MRMNPGIATTSLPLREHKPGSKKYSTYLFLRPGKEGERIINPVLT